MEPFDPRRRRTSAIRRFFLDLDARLNDGGYRLAGAISRGYGRIADLSDKAQLYGWRRWTADAASEGMTLGTIGLVLLLALAIPAFKDANEDFVRKGEFAVVFEDRYGNEIGRRGVRHNDSVPLEEFPDHMVKAVLATEDRRFFEHYGIDLIGTVRAVTANARARGVVQGGSTLTQQLAKNLFLSNERTLDRKVREAFLALWLEARLSKKDILKMYLDRAYMGGGAFGLEAATEYYFGKSVREVSLAEAAMLAGLFKAPTRFAPHINLPAARARAATVLSNLVEAGFMTEAQVFAANRNPATPVERRGETPPNYYLDYAFEDVKRVVNANPRIVDRTLVVRTGLDLSIQRAAETAIETTLRQFGDEYNASQGAVVVMDLDGIVRAVVGGRDYGASQFNRATEAMRQSGSSFKPIVYGTAMQRGLINARSTVVDRPICLGNWCPQNYGRSFGGQMSVVTAMARSFNTVPVMLSLQIGNGDARIGRNAIIETARAMGISRPLTNSAPLPIGAAETTLLELTTAYGAFASGGRALNTHAAVEIRTMGGEVLWRADRDSGPTRQVFSPAVAADMSVMLQAVVEAGTGRRAAVDGVQVVGKTGTTNSYRDALFVGYSGHLVTGVWFGNDDFSESNRMTGGSLPAMAFRQVMTAAHQGLEPRAAFGLTDPRQPRSPQALANAPLPVGLGRTSAYSRRMIEALGRIEDLMTEAGRPPQGTAPSPVSDLPRFTVVR